MADTETLGHSASLSFNYTGNKDLNKFAIGESDVKTTAIGANYTLSVKPWATDFGITLSDQTSRGYKTKYTSRIGTFTTGHTFFEENPLNISGSISLVYNEVERQSKSLNIGGDISASYTLKQYHVFSASASFYKYGDVNPPSCAAASTAPTSPSASTTPTPSASSPSRTRRNAKCSRRSGWSASLRSPKVSRNSRQRNQRI